MCLCNMPQPSCDCTVLSTPDYDGRGINNFLVDNANGGLQSTRRGTG